MSAPSSRGFTLIQMCAIIFVLGLLSVALLPQSQTAINAQQITMERSVAIQDAMARFIATNQYIPCPALGYSQVTQAEFGVAATNASSCNTANLMDATATDGRGVAGVRYFIGTVPVKTLGLPLETTFDGYGRRFTYAVDDRAVNITTFAALNVAKNPGVLNIRRTAASITNQSYARWLLLSHGMDGHGAYPQNPAATGVDETSRFNAGTITDADTLTNANVDAAFAASIDNIFVGKPAAANFDDMLLAGARNYAP